MQYQGLIVYPKGSEANRFRAFLMQGENMTASVIQLNAHENMTPEQCLSYAARNADDYDDVIIVGVAKDGGHVLLNSSHMSREFATFVLLEALDMARGK